MKAHTKINYQGGESTFAMVPYGQFKPFIDQLKTFIDKQDEATVPHEVARAVLIDDKSMLKAWREHLNLSQSTLAAKAGMTRLAIAQLEKSPSGLREATLKKIATAMGIDVDQLREI